MYFLFCTDCAAHPERRIRRYTWKALATAKIFELQHVDNMSSFLFKVFRQSHVTKTEDNTATTRSPISSRNNGLETVEGEWSNGSRCRDGQQQRQVPTRQDNNQTRDSRYSSKVYISSELRERGIRQEEPTGMAKVAEAENDSVDKESPCKHQQQNPPKQSEVIDLCSNDSDDDSVDYDRDNQCKRDGTQKASEDHSAGKVCPAR